MFGSFVGGAIGGAAGAALWAAVAYFFGYEIGWIAWGIGGLVGFGVAAGNRGDGRVATGVLAASLAVLSIAAGKYATVQLLLPDVEEMIAQMEEAASSDEYLISYLADDVALAREEAGQAIAWPDGAEPYMGTTASEYPADVWSEALASWEAMPTERQQAYRDSLVGDVTANAELYRSLVATAGFIGTFSLMDIVFVVLAIATAYRVAGPQAGEAEPELVAGETPREAEPVT